MFNSLRSSSGASSRRRTAALCVAAVLAGYVVSHADAAPGRSGGHTSFGSRGWTVNIRIGHPRVRTDHHHDARPTLRSHHHGDYQAGVLAGRREGAAAGYNDGLCGHSYCDDPRAELCGRSQGFLHGYAVGYRNAYRDAFERGRHDRQHAHHHGRGRVIHHG